VWRSTIVPRPALLVLEDGAAYRGEAVVGAGTIGGEIVFNTAMTGYQEIATDPSYCGQIITYTFPLNGNYGADPARDESDQAHVRAIIARELVNYAFNRASTTSWLDWLNAHGVLAVGGIDTRALTRHIRNQGALRAVVSTDDPDVSSLRRRAQKLPRMTGLDLASVVTCAEPREALAATGAPAEGGEPFHVVALDFGIKRSILGCLRVAGCRVTVVPAATPSREILKLRPDGVFLSNGPGDPAAVTYAVKTVQRLLGKAPLFGICLGHQVLALALGMSTYKLKFGHRGANHPVKDLTTGKIEVTTQNHGFAVRDDGASAHDVTARVTHLNLNDGTVEGLAAPALYAFSVQYHPESTPGPHDSLHLFGRFGAEMRRFAGERPRATVRAS
jgi:carbamoyl-phosphate synthase small subunit